MSEVGLIRRVDGYLEAQLGECRAALYVTLGVVVLLPTMVASFILFREFTIKFAIDSENRVEAYRLEAHQKLLEGER